MFHFETLAAALAELEQTTEGLNLLVVVTASTTPI